MRSRTDLVILWLPFVFMAVIVALRVRLGIGWGLTPLVVVGPALAAVAGQTRRTVAAGAVAVAVSAMFEMSVLHTYPQSGVVEAGTAIGVTAAGVVVSRARARRDKDLYQARLVADTVQQLLLRRVPDRVGPVRFAVRYQSATSGARVGGDLYDVVATPQCVRLIIGDAQGKGLAAVRSAAAVLNVFRDAAYEADSLLEMADRIEASLAREVDDEQFVTAVLAQLSLDGTTMEVLNCGHPAPLLLGGAAPRTIGEGSGNLPLGLGYLGGGRRSSVTTAVTSATPVLFYTDGLSETRNSAGDFFPLDAAQALVSPSDPGTLIRRLSDEVAGFRRGEPNDDMALLLVYGDPQALRAAPATAPGAVGTEARMATGVRAVAGCVPGCYPSARRATSTRARSSG